MGSNGAKIMEIISRAEAKQKQKSTYFTGQPCKHGHVTYRYTQSGTCSQCINGDHKRIVDPNSMARKEAKAQLVQVRVRAFDDDRDNIAAAAWALAVMRFPILTQGDVDPRLLPGDRTAGTGLYAFYCHEADVGTLRAIAAAAINQRGALNAQAVAAKREEVLRANLAAADIDTAPPMSFK
jgi:hypothetical protein